MQHDLETETRQGINKLELMLCFIPLLMADDTNDYGEKIAKVFDFLEEKLNRKITPEEKQKMLIGVKNYVLSEAGTNERINATNYLFNLEFIN